MAAGAELHHGFGGGGQKGGFAQGQGQLGQQHQHHALGTEGGGGQQAAANGEAAEAEREAGPHRTLGQRLTHRPLNHHQQPQLQADGQGAQALRQGAALQAAPHQIQRQGTLHQGRQGGGQHGDGQDRQQRRQPAAHGAGAFQLAFALGLGQGPAPQQDDHHEQTADIDQVDAPQLTLGGQQGTDHGATDDAESIGTAHQGKAPGRRDRRAAERDGQLDRRPVEPHGDAQQQLAAHIATEALGTEQDRVPQQGTEAGQQHRQGATQAPIQQHAAEQAPAGAGQGRQGQAGRDTAGTEGFLVEHHRCEVEHPTGSHHRDQPDSGQIAQRHGKLVPPGLSPGP